LRSLQKSDEAGGKMTGERKRKNCFVFAKRKIQDGKNEELAKLEDEWEKIKEMDEKG
jgi:hypothetical protein